jgi:hypothetical protein
MFKKDFFLLGVIIGAILPLLFAMGTTFVNIHFLNNPEFDMIKSKPTLMLSLVFNIILFRIFMVNLKKHNMGKGLLLVTLIYILLIIAKH